MWILIRGERLGAVPAAIFGAHRTHQFFDAGVDVGAVEGEMPASAEGDEIVDRGGAVDGAVAAGELPAAADERARCRSRDEG